MFLRNVSFVSSVSVLHSEPASLPFLINDHSCHLQRRLIKGLHPTTSHRASFSPSHLPRCSPLLLLLGPRSPAAPARSQIDISGIDIYCSGRHNHFHFTLCCTGEIRHLRGSANQMSFNRTLWLTFTTVYPLISLNAAAELLSAEHTEQPKEQEANMQIHKHVKEDKPGAAAASVQRTKEVKAGGVTGPLLLSSAKQLLLLLLHTVLIFRQ